MLLFPLVIVYGHFSWHIVEQIEQVPSRHQGTERDGVEQYLKSAFMTLSFCGEQNTHQVVKEQDEG